MRTYPNYTQDEVNDCFSHNGMLKVCFEIFILLMKGLYHYLNYFCCLIS